MLWITNEDGTEAHSAPSRYYVTVIPEGFVCLDRHTRPLEMSEPRETIEEAQAWAEERQTAREVAA